jgi:SAM-dependent methyltransferase
MRPPSGARPFDDWADIYDKVYADLDHDLPFYVRQAVASGRPVLELGCGTGRVALAMAEAGVDVVGVDISPRMVEVAQAKAAECGLAERARFQVGDMRSVRLGERFALVTIPFRGLLLLTSAGDQRAALATAAAHLTPGGALVFDVFNPDPELLADTGDEHFVDSVVPQPGGGSVIVYATNRWDHTAQLSTPHLWIEERDAEGMVLATHERDFSMRYVWPGEMTAMLYGAGFEVEALYGGFDGEPVAEGCDDLAWVARRR